MRVAGRLAVVVSDPKEIDMADTNFHPAPRNPLRIGLLVLALLVPAAHQASATSIKVGEGCTIEVKVEYRCEADVKN